METFETLSTFRKLQLDTSHPLQRQHPGSSTLSLSLSRAGSRSNLASTPRAPPPTPTTHAPTPISVRISQQSRVFDTYSQQCTDTPELSSSGRYAQSNFTLSPLERAARADSASLFEHFQPKGPKHGFRALGNDEQFDARKRAVPQPGSQLVQTIQSAIEPAVGNEEGKALIRQRTPPVRSNTESEKFNYDFTSGCRRGAAVGPREQLIRENDAAIEGREDGFDTRPNYRAIEPTSLMNQPRRRFLSPSPFEKLIEDSGRMSSLTSNSSIGSPLSEALATPTDSECSDMYGPTLAHVARCQSFQDPISLEETSAWPTGMNAVRNKSYNFEIAAPGSGRRKRRAFSEKRLSPAHQFLSGWQCQKAPEPDDEGQEVGAYVMGKQIGFGGFSIVKEATTMNNGMKVIRAVKIVRKQAHSRERENDKIQAEFEKEVSIWRYLSHPHILPLIEVYDSPYATFCFTKLVSGGNLLDLMKKNRHGLPAHVAQKYAYQLASAIRYLHEDVRIIHRDIKLENCLIDVSVDDEGSLLLCDFGLAEQMPGSSDDSDSESSYGSDGERQKNHRDVSTEIKGSLQYASPEMMAIIVPPLTAAVDIWAFGIVLYALHVGDLPFNHTFQPKLQMMIAKGDWDVEKFRNTQAFVGDDEMAMMALVVVKGCLCKNVEQRWTIDRVLESEWLEHFSAESP